MSAFPHPFQPMPPPTPARTPRDGQRGNSGVSASSGFDLVTLRLLLAAVEEGHLGRAAEREHIAISALSRRISEFEARCGVPLLIRTKRGVEPTSACDSVIGDIQAIIDLLRRIDGTLDEVRGGVCGHVRARAHMSATSGALPARVAAFQAEHPGVHIAIEEATSVDILHAVRVGACDLGLVSGTMREEGLCFIPWLKDELVAVLPPGSPLRTKGKLSFAEMLDIPFIGMQRDSALLSLYRKEAAGLGGTLLVRANAASFETARNMVKAGLGVTILPVMAVAPFAEEQGLVLRPLVEPWARRELMLCVRNMATISPATRLFIAHLSRAEVDAGE